MYISQGNPKNGIYDLGIVVAAVGIDTSTVHRFVSVILEDKTTKCSFIIYVQTEGRTGWDFNLARAKNHGILALIERCRVICCTDVDMLIPPGLLDYTTNMTKNDHLWVLCRNINPNETTRKAWEEWLLLKERPGNGSWNSMSSANWVKVGGWDERCYGWGGEDDILHARIKQSGIRTLSCKDWSLCHVCHPRREFSASITRSRENIKFIFSIQPNYLANSSVAEESSHNAAIPLRGIRIRPFLRRSGFNTASIR